MRKNTWYAVYHQRELELLASSYHPEYPFLFRSEVKKAVSFGDFGDKNEYVLLGLLNNSLKGTIATCPLNGVMAKSITAYIKITLVPHKVKLALYKKSDRSFVGQTEEISVPVQDWTWIPFNMIGNPALENIDYYILGWAENLGFMEFAYLGTTNVAQPAPHKRVFVGVAYDGFPDPLPAPFEFDGSSSIYCTYQG